MKKEKISMMNKPDWQSLPTDYRLEFPEYRQATIYDERDGKDNGDQEPEGILQMEGNGRQRNGSDELFTSLVALMM